jgi:hypothetical protein
LIDAHRRRTDKFDRERVFIADNAADFPANSRVDLISVQINAKLAQALALDAKLASAYGDKLQARDLKGNTRDELIETFRDIALGAIAVGDATVPGITAKYKMPYPRTEQNLIASADAWFADTAPIEAQFIAAGLDADFRDVLINNRNAFQTARDQSDSADEDYGEAVGALDVLFRELMEHSRQRAALVKLKYKNNPGKLAAWAIASHLEHPPKKGTPAA